MTPKLYLIAHVTNAQSEDTAEVELEVATQSVDGTWSSNAYPNLLPFWAQEIEMALPPIPEGWLEHVHEEAIRFASSRQVSKVSLADALGLNLQRQSTAPIRRRV